MLSRILLAMILALAIALGPLAMPGEAAMAAAPVPHHGEMAAQGHCDQQPQPDPQDRQDKAEPMCCAAGCMAAAQLPAPALQSGPVSASRERPSPDRFRLGYLGEIATPPPRIA